MWGKEIGNMVGGRYPCIMRVPFDFILLGTTTAPDLLLFYGRIFDFHRNGI